MQIFIYGNDTRLVECRRLLCQAIETGAFCERRFADIHLLPIPSRAVKVEDMKSNLCVLKETEGEGVSPCVNCPCCEGKPTVKKSLVVGYEVPSFFYEMDGVEVFDLSFDERFLWRNARLCALGTLGVVLTAHTRVPSELHIGVIGYGRIGREVCELFSFLETPLVVFTSNTEALTSLTERSIPSILVNWKEKVRENVNSILQNNGISTPIDILINTSPTPLGETFFDGFVGTVYDLASGKPIPESVVHTRLSSLPMRMYAQSAGHAVYQAILEHFISI